MKTYKDFVLLEYRHFLGDGTDKPSIQANNGKNPNRVGPDKKYLFTKGPYKTDFPGINIKGTIFTGHKLTDILDSMNWIFEDGKVFKNFKNTGNTFRMYMDKMGPAAIIE